MTDIELIQKIAEIEVLDISASGHRLHYKGYIINPFDNHKEAKALLWDLVVKYEININHAHGFVFMAESDGYWDYAEVYFTDAEHLPRAILECIIEACGGHDGN